MNCRSLKIPRNNQQVKEKEEIESIVVLKDNQRVVPGITRLCGTICA